MQPRTAGVAAVVVGALVLAAVVGFGATGGGDLSERWLSDTGRDVAGNHHAPAGGVVDGRGLVFAPISAESGSARCGLVALHAANGTSAWSAAIPAANCTIHSVADPTLADFDDDGDREVLAATTERAVVAHDPSTGDVEWRHPLSSYGYSQAVVADLVPGGGSEVVVADVKGSVFAVRHGNGTAWSRSLAGLVWGQPAVVDLDADGDPELAVGHGGGRVVAIEGDGSVRWNRTTGLDSSVTWMTAGDLDGDPPVEVVAATDGGRVVALDGRNGSVEWSRTFARFAAVGPPGDGDGDGRTEVYVTARDGELRALDARTGETEWTATLTVADVQMTPPPAMGDVDGDGDPELVAVSNDGVASVVDPATGEVLATYERDVPVFTHPTLADTDGDGTPEIYVIYGDGRVAALEYDGE